MTLTTFSSVPLRLPEDLRLTPEQFALAADGLMIALRHTGSETSGPPALNRSA